jgi:hypothetical protein
MYKVGDLKLIKGAGILEKKRILSNGIMITTEWSTV